MVLMALITIHLSVSPAFSAVQQQKKTAAKKTAVKKTTAQKKGVTQKKGTTKKNSAPKKPTVTVNSLKNEQAQVRKQIREQERRLRANEQDVKKRLQNLMALTEQIPEFHALYAS